MPTYQYRPLPAHGEIRILQVRPGHKADGIDCRLKQVSIASSDREDYDALSYAWEVQTPREAIQLDGDPFLVTPNVFSALKHLRLKKERRTLWIDAVCIDQQNNDERRDQVAQMRHIFHNAEKVIVWLGDGDDDSAYAMDWLKVTTAHEFVSFPRAVVRLLNRPWWRRIWVLQEVVAARLAPIIKCGDKEINWEHLSCVQSSVPPTNWMEFMNRFPRGKRGAVSGVAGDDAFLSLANLLRNHSEYLSWREALTIRVTMEASDERDLTYALLGLMPDCVRSRIRPDYKRPAAEVFDTTMKAALCTDSALETLSLAIRPFSSDIPSWIPDLENGTPTLFLEHGVDVYSAAGSSTRNVQFLEDGKVMVITGVLIDRITAIAKEKGRTKVSRSKNLAYCYGKNFGLKDDQIRERFWRTLIMNQGKSYPTSKTVKIEYPAPQHYGHRYMVWQKEAEVPSEEIGEGEVFEWHLEYMKPFFYSKHKHWERGLACFFVTANKRFGLAQKGIQTGDTVCIFAGGKVTYVLREYRVSESAKAKLIREIFKKNHRKANPARMA